MSTGNLVKETVEKIPPRQEILIFVDMNVRVRKKGFKTQWTYMGEM